MTVIIGTGHRPQKLKGGFQNKKLHQKIKEKIRKVLIDKKVDIIISGMTLGFDQWLAEEAIAANIQFTAALPFEGQERKWPPKSQQHYKWLLSKAIHTVYVDREAGYISDVASPGVYHPHKMFRRNEWMVDQLKNGDILLSLWDKRDKGGTYQCIEYAKSKDSRTIHINIDPTKLSN